MELITTHTHTCFTNHGEGTVEELVSAAVAAGVSTIHRSRRLSTACRASPPSRSPSTIR